MLGLENLVRDEPTCAASAILMRSEQLRYLAWLDPFIICPKRVSEVQRCLFRTMPSYHACYRTLSLKCRMASAFAPETAFDEPMTSLGGLRRYFRLCF